MRFSQAEDDGVRLHLISHGEAQTASHCCEAEPEVLADDVSAGRAGSARGNL